MSKKIKFRVWIGSKMEYDILVGELGAFYASIDPKDSASVINTKYPENIIPMAFSGLKDKHGKDIYEGDVFKSISNSLGNCIKTPVLEYEDLRWSLIEKSSELRPNNFEYLDYYEGTELEVIGNIHQTN